MLYHIDMVDTGIMPDRWPHTTADHLPTITHHLIIEHEQVGYIIVTPSRNRITNLFIERKFRGRGYANILFDYAYDKYNITNFCASVYDGIDDVGRLISWHLTKGFVPATSIEMVKK